MDFKSLSTLERKVANALRSNVDNKAILTDRKDTSFVGIEDEISESEVICAIRSVPTHY